MTQPQLVPFEILVYSTPTDPEKKGEVIVDRKTVMAPSQKVAELMAARLIPDAWASRLDEVVVRVKSF